MIWKILIIINNIIMKKPHLIAIGFLVIANSSLAMMHFEDEHPPSISPTHPLLRPSAATSSHDPVSQPQHTANNNTPLSLLPSCLRNNDRQPSVNSVEFANPPAHDDSEYGDQHPLQPPNNNAVHTLPQRQHTRCACRNNEHMDTTCCLALCAISCSMGFIAAMTIYTYTLYSS